MDAFDREVERLEEALASGEVTNTEFNHEMRELKRDYGHTAEQAAHDAYDDVMERW